MRDLRGLVPCIVKAAARTSNRKYLQAYEEQSYPFVFACIHSHKCVREMKLIEMSNQSGFLARCGLCRNLRSVQLCVAS